jgi:hypothetical protein
MPLFGFFAGAFAGVALSGELAAGCRVPCDRFSPGRRFAHGPLCPVGFMHHGCRVHLFGSAAIGGTID